MVLVVAIFFYLQKSRIILFMVASIRNMNMNTPLATAPAPASASASASAPKKKEWKFFQYKKSGMPLKTEWKFVWMCVIFWSLQKKKNSETKKTHGRIHEMVQCAIHWLVHFQSSIKAQMIKSSHGWFFFLAGPPLFCTTIMEFSSWVFCTAKCSIVTNEYYSVSVPQFSAYAFWCY